jgi:hypothetical protein
MTGTGSLTQNTAANTNSLKLPGERLAFASGIVYVIILIVATIHFILNVLPILPQVGSPPAEYAQFYLEHGRLMIYTNYVFALPVPFFLFFIAGLYNFLRRQATDGTLAMAALAAGLTMIVPWLRNIVVETSAASIAQYGGDAAVIAVFDGFGPMTYSMGGLPRLVLILATTIVLRQTGIAPRWLSWLGFAAALLSLLGSLTFITAAFFPFTMLGLVVSGIWLLALNLRLLRYSQI